MKYFLHIITTGAMLFLTGCNLCAPSTKIDAVTGATGLGAEVQNVSADEARKIIVAFLKTSGPYYFATCDGSQARVRPIGIFVEHDSKLWFHVGKHKDSYRQLQQYPKIEISATAQNGDWIRITGTAVPQFAKEVDDAAFNHTPSLRKIYNEKTGRTLGHFYIKNGVAEISKRDGKVLLYKF